LQLGDEGHQLDDLPLCAGQLFGNDSPQAILNDSALTAVPGKRQVGDLVEAAAELLGPSDEGQTLDRPLVVQSIARRRTSRLWEEADLLVVAQCCRGEPAAIGDIFDLHFVSVNPQARLKVKRFWS
jgi:hypothetical protein